jgi:hypothetical protein
MIAARATAHATKTQLTMVAERLCAATGLHPDRDMDVGMWRRR